MKNSDKCINCAGIYSLSCHSCELIGSCPVCAVNLIAVLPEPETQSMSFLEMSAAEALTGKSYISPSERYYDRTCPTCRLKWSDIWNAYNTRGKESVRALFKEKGKQ